MELQKIFSSEWKKLVLPSLAVFFMLFSILGLYNIRATGIDAEVTQTSFESIHNRGVEYGEKFAYNISMNQSRTDIEKPAQEWMQNPVNFASVGSIFAVYWSPTFLLEPSDTLLLENPDSTFFKPSQGYFLSREVPETLLKIRYTGLKSQQVMLEANRTNMSLSTYRERMNRIGNVTLNDSVVRELEQLRNQSRPLGDPTAGVVGNLEGGFDLRDVYLDQGFQEVQWYHFAPGLIATFVFWFVVNALMVESVRKVRELV